MEYSIIHLFLDFRWVTTCNVTKTACINCDQSGPPCGSCPMITSQKQCYDGVDGSTFVMSEYKTDSSTCLYRYCFYTDMVYAVNRVVTMMTCSSGILKNANIPTIFF